MTNEKRITELLKELNTLGVKTNIVEKQSKNDGNKTIAEVFGKDSVVEKVGFGKKLSLYTSYEDATDLKRLYRG